MIALPADQSIPSIMKESQQWIVWKLEGKTDVFKGEKIPYSAKNPYRHASSTNPKTWGYFGEVIPLAQLHNMSGVGYVFTKEQGIIAIDVDDCIKDGIPTEKGKEILSLFSGKTYIETSQSGKGLHILATGNLKTTSFDDIEVYTSGRYFAITGNIIGECNTINQTQNELDLLCDKYGRVIEEKPITWEKSHQKNTTTGNIVDRLNLRVQDMGYPGNAQKSGTDEIRGAHPFHGSKTGTNYAINTNRNVWVCRRHGTGGGALELFAMKEGIIRCEDSKSGCLEGKWKEIFKALKNDGYDLVAAGISNPPQIQQSLPTPTVASVVTNPHSPPHYILQNINSRSGVTTNTLIISAYADFLHNHFSTVYFNKTLYIYDHGLNFYRVQTNEIETHIRQTTLEFGITKKLQDLTTEIKAHLMAMGGYTEYPFNLNNSEIPVENGIVRIDYDSKVVSIIPHDPSHMFTYKLSIVYDPKIKNCDAIWLLKRMVDTEDIKTLIQIPAQAILQMQTGHAYKKAYLLQGEPHAGKTSYLKLLYAMFGDNFTCSVSLQQLCEDRFVGGNLEGKLLNIYDDLEDIALRVIDQFKTLTGDCRHGIERKHIPKYTGKVTSVHIFTCNYPPEYPERVKRDAAFWARWEYVKFPYAYPVNPNFYSEWYTQERLSSFFNLILAAMIHIKKRGLLSNSGVQDVMINWSVNSDPLYDFITDYFEPYGGSSPNHYSKAKLYHLYQDWCNDREIPEYKRKVTQHAFTTAIQAHRFIPSQKKEKREIFETYATTAYKVRYNEQQIDIDYRTSPIW